MALITLIILGALITIFLVIFVKDFIKSHKNNQKYHKGEVIMAFVLLLPAVVMTFLFVILPIFMSLGYSFTNYNLNLPDEIEIAGDGFDNFRDLFKEFSSKGIIYRAVINTLLFVALVVPLQIGLALALALFCSAKIKGSAIFKVCFFTPVVVSLTVTSYLWLEILSPSETGLLNSFLALFGQPAKDFLKDPDTAIIWVVVVSAWQGCGFQMLIL